MNTRYNLKAAEPYPILTETQVKKFDLVVCCADNLDVRRMLYRAAMSGFSIVVGMTM